MQFVAQHTIHIVFYYVCVQKFFLFQLCFWRNENKEINLISSALIKTCDYGAKVLMYVLNCCFARVTNNLVVRFNSTNKNKNNWQKTVLINAPLLANLSKRKLIISQRHAIPMRKKRKIKFRFSEKASNISCNIPVDLKFTKETSNQMRGFVQFLWSS